MLVNLNIGRLTVHGATRADGVRIGNALRGRLQELASSGIPLRAAKGVTNINRLDAGTLAPGASAEQTGRQIADRIFGTLKGRRDA